MPAAGRITLQRGLTRTTGQHASVPFRVRRSRRLRRRGLEASSLLVRELESANGQEPTVTVVGFGAGQLGLATCGIGQMLPSVRVCRRVAGYLSNHSQLEGKSPWSTPFRIHSSNAND